MTGPMTHDEAADLVGAFALDALDEEEARSVAVHVVQCRRCATEVAEHREVAAMLANSGGDAPVHLWEQISDLIDRPDVAGPVKPPVTSLFSKRDENPGQGRGAERRGRRHGAFPKVVITAAAAAVIVIAVLGVQVSRLDNRVGQLQVASQRQGIVQAAQAALSDPGARRVALDASNSSGPSVAEIVILPSGTAFVLNSRLPGLPANETYQLWGRRGGELISLGLLGGHPSDVPFRVDPSASISDFAVTAEHAGGVVRTTQVPVAVSQTLNI